MRVVLEVAAHVSDKWKNSQNLLYLSGVLCPRNLSLFFDRPMAVPMC